MSAPHDSPIKTPKQLIVIVVLAFVVPITLIVLLSQLVTGGEKGAAQSDADVLTRIQPVGQVKLAAPSGPKVAMTGEQVFNQVCKTCHETGVAGAPKFGDKAAWGKVIAQGESTLVDHATKGIRGMPPKGGNPDLDDVEVHRAVVYMANAGGAGWKEPAAAPPAAASGERTGEQVVDAVCSKCHKTGEHGSPKLGDRAAWTKRVANRGLAAVTQSALKGHAGMPARGGMAELSDNEVKAAVEFMMNSGVTRAPDKAEAGAAPAPAAAPATSAAPAPAAAPATSAAPAASAAPSAAGAADGKKVYESTCTVCHGTGAAGAPKFGDKAAWAPRLKGGLPALYATALKGKNAMPPRGGNVALSDAEVKAAVDYMAAAAK